MVTLLGVALIFGAIMLFSLIAVLGMCGVSIVVDRWFLRSRYRKTVDNGIECAMRAAVSGVVVGALGFVIFVLLALGFWLIRIATGGSL